MKNEDIDKLEAVAEMSVEEALKKADENVLKYDGKLVPSVSRTLAAEVRRLREQDARHEEHYQAAMTMGEKHRKNWVEAARKLQDIQNQRAELAASNSEKTV